MGDPKKIRKKYKTPGQPFERTRIDEELQIIGKYGLRNMKEVWKHKTMLANYRSNARRLLSYNEEDRKIGEQEILGTLQRLGILTKNANLDDVLSMNVENFLDRRLQTLVFKKALSTTPYHARQMVIHGHITIGDRIINSPSYMVPLSEEGLINYSQFSPLKNSSHKALPGNIYKGRPREAIERRDGRHGKRMPMGAKPAKRKLVEEVEEDVDILALPVEPTEVEKSVEKVEEKQ